MSIRVEYLTTKLQSYLLRRTMPRGLDGKPDAQTEELSALISCLGRYAPKENYDEWWGNFERVLGEDAQTRAWPTEGEIKAAATKLRKPGGVRVAEAGDSDPLELNAKRIRNREAVGDEYLFGRRAVELLQSGKVTMSDIRPYRSALYFSEKDFYGEEMAKSREEERLRKHERAESMCDGIRRERSVTIPSKRAPMEAAE